MRIGPYIHNTVGSKTDKSCVTGILSRHVGRLMAPPKPTSSEVGHLFLLEIFSHDDGSPYTTLPRVRPGFKMIVIYELA